MHARLEKRFPLANGSELFLDGNVTWKDNHYFEPFNLPNAAQDAYAEWGGRIGWVSTDRRWEAIAWGRNLGDETAVLNNIVSSDVSGFPRIGALNEPRTYGVDISYQF